jgi:hypothetical protein
MIRDSREAGGVGPDPDILWICLLSDFHLISSLCKYQMNSNQIISTISKLRADMNHGEPRKPTQISDSESSDIPFHLVPNDRFRSDSSDKGAGFRRRGGFIAPRIIGSTFRMTMGDAPFLNGEWSRCARWRLVALLMGSSKGMEVTHIHSKSCLLIRGRRNPRGWANPATLHSGSMQFTWGSWDFEIFDRITEIGKSDDMKCPYLLINIPATLERFKFLETITDLNRCFDMAVSDDGSYQMLEDLSLFQSEKRLS